MKWKFNQSRRTQTRKKRNKQKQRGKADQTGNVLQCETAENNPKTSVIIIHTNVSRQCSLLVQTNTKACIKALLIQRWLIRFFNFSIYPSQKIFDTKKLEKMHQANVNQRKTGIAVSVSDKADCKTKSVIWFERVYSQIIKGVICIELAKKFIWNVARLFNKGLGENANCA